VDLKLKRHLRLTALLALLLALLLPAWAEAASKSPPLPRPRPASRTEAPATPSPAPAAQTSVAPQNPPANAAPAAGNPQPAITDEISAPAPSTAAAAASAIAAKPQAVTLTALITDGGAPLSDGLVWRVFNSQADAKGQMPLVAKSSSATAKFNLAPGDYVVHVAYGRAQATDTLTVGAGDNNKALILDAGALRLNASITGDVQIPVELLHFDVFTAGATDADRTLVAQNIAPSNILTLNAGTYHIVSYFGAVNAVVRADLRVEPGQLTEATLYHKAAQVAFKLVSEAGGEAIADVDWTVKTADGTTVFSNTGAFPTAVFAEGDYLVLAKRGAKVYNRQFQVMAGKAQDIEVLTTVY
jgi:hypothetical protein